MCDVNYCFPLPSMGEGDIFCQDASSVEGSISRSRFMSILRFPLLRRREMVFFVRRLVLFLSDPAHTIPHCFWSTL